jgi:hypothetical protein
MKGCIREVIGPRDVERVGDYYYSVFRPVGMKQKGRTARFVCNKLSFGQHGSKRFTIEIVEKWRPTVWHYVWTLVTVVPAVSWLLL